MKYFKNDTSGKSFEAAVCFGAGISAATFVAAISINQLVFAAQHLGGRVRVAVSTMVYKKVCQLVCEEFGITHGNPGLGDTF